ncbi:Uncharacterized protein HZ326_15511 [Fusarium oxysporum f. sp. albedinis]|nr:Uncharacterized protein HZ326_15511 [Fusarium oxysporum f. sp. albedinis]
MRLSPFVIVRLTVTDWCFAEKVRRSSAFYLISYVFYPSKFPVIGTVVRSSAAWLCGYFTFHSTRRLLFRVLLLISGHVFSCLLLASVSKVIFSLSEAREPLLLRSLLHLSLLNIHFISAHI